jgi:2,3-bisphosphoglycerate-independent phosphoglycerate mutase
MNIHDLVAELREGVESKSKIVLLVADGLGGLPRAPGGKTELEMAKTPNLDACARDGVCGLSLPVLPGITPGSGPGHLGLFGYDPLQYRIGRGILEALGIGFKIDPARDVAIRANFVTMNGGVIADRRAGRPKSEVAAPQVTALQQIKLSGVEVFVEPVREHRFVVVLRGDGLGDKVNDTDPQREGVAPLVAEGDDEPSKKTARLANDFIAQALRILKAHPTINGCTFRGFARYPQLRTMSEVYGLKTAAIAVYPMYRGLARLAGMDILDAGDTLDSQVARLRAAWDQYDFFFLHYKYTDSTGEDGNFDEKVKKIEELDAAIPRMLDLRPDVFIVTGDHSTPSLLKSHSWHPVPTLIRAATARTDGVTEFGEESCLRGGLGQFEAKYLMLLAMAHAKRFGKYGA